MQNNSSKDYYSFEMPVKLIIEETLFMFVQYK